MAELRGETTWIDVEGPIQATDNAYLYDTEVGEVWLPRSQIGAIKKNDKGMHERIEITKWIAGKKDLLDEKDDR